MFLQFLQLVQKIEPKKPLEQKFMQRAIYWLFEVEFRWYQFYINFHAFFFLAGLYQLVIHSIQ